MGAQLFRGGRILTLSQSAGDAVLVEDGIVTDVGDAEWLRGRSQFRQIEEIDLDGATLMPGFVDGHVHLELSCITQDLHLHLHAPPVHALSEILEAIAERRVLQPHGWITVRSSFALDRKVEESRLLDRDDLDRVSPQAPVVVLAGLHVASINTAAMRLLGLDDDSAITDGMTAHRRPDGSLSGVFTEIWDRLPVATEQETASALRAHAGKLFARHGTTSLSTIPTSTADVRALQTLERAGELPFRIRAYPHVPRVGSLDSILSLGATSGFGNEMLSFGGVKIFVDGEGGDGLGAHFDDLKWKQPDLNDLVARATEARVQLFMHAVTEAGIAAALEAVERSGDFRAAGLPAPHRIEHAGDYVTPRILPRLAASGVGVVTTPHFVSSDVVDKEFQPLRRLIDAGVHLIGATDTTGTVPEGASPLANICMAVTRRDAAGDPSPHRVSTLEGIKMFTEWSASGQGEFGKKGQIRPGAFADFAVLAEHPLHVDPERLDNIEVLGTFVGGVPVDGAA